MQVIHLKYPLTNEVKQKKASQKNVEKVYFLPIAKDPDLNNGVKKRQKLRSWFLLPLVIEFDSFI